MKRLKSKKGITLISLVITVIVILVLAVVAVSLITQKDSVFNAAQDASNKYNTEASEEQNVLASLGNKVAIEAGTADNSTLLAMIKQLQGEIEELKASSSTGGGALSAYPVGSIYISTNSTDPSELFGGTWEAYGQGRTLIGVGTGTDANSTEREFTANEAGGEYTHRLTVAEMPSHSHDLTNGGRVFSMDGTGTNPNAGLVDNAALWKGHNKNTVEIKSTGGSESHNNIQPYIATYMWKRIG